MNREIICAAINLLATNKYYIAAYSDVHTNRYMFTYLSIFFDGHLWLEQQLVQVPAQHKEIEAQICENCRKQWDRLKRFFRFCRTAAFLLLHGRPVCTTFAI